MPFEGLLTKLGPTLVREATPHLMQLVAGLGERFRKDTRDIKVALETELASLAHSHAGLITAAADQRDRLTAIQENLAAADRRVELLQRSLDTLSRQLASEAAEVAKAQRTTRTFALLAMLFSAVASAATLASFLLHR